MKGIYLSAASLFLTLFIMGCDAPVPIMEMVKARDAISKAYTVKADKYAAAELTASESKLYENHDFIKAGNYDKSRISADDSFKKAVEAYNKAIPLLAKDTIATAKASIVSAEEVYAEKLAQDDLQSSKDLLVKAEAENGSSKFYEAYLTALEADKKAKSAIGISSGKKDLLKDSIDEVKLTLLKANEYENLSSASGKISIANENLKIAEESYNNSQLKKGFSAVQVAKINADEALVLAAEGTAKEKIANAEILFDQAIKSEGSSVAIDELAASRESINNAKVMLSNSKYREAIEYTKESARLSSIVIATKKPADTDADKDKNKTVSMGNADKDKDKDKDSDKDTDKDSLKDKKSVSAVSEDENYFYYKVKYNPKWRDCLWTIAQNYYKNPKLWTLIYNANKELIKNPDMIQPDWVIKVPKQVKK